MIRLRPHRPSRIERAMHGLVHQAPPAAPSAPCRWCAQRPAAVGQSCHACTHEGADDPLGPVRGVLNALGIVGAVVMWPDRAFEAAVWLVIAVCAFVGYRMVGGRR